MYGLIQCLLEDRDNGLVDFASAHSLNAFRSPIRYFQED